MEVFISYAHENRDTATTISALLDRMGIPNFLDQKKIPWGGEIEDSVRDAMSRCRAVIVLVSPDALKSQWVPYELGCAKALGKIVLPFAMERLAEVPLFISNLNCFTTIDMLERYFKEWQLHRLRRPVSRSLVVLDNEYVTWWEAQNARRQDGPVNFQGLEFELSRSVFSPDIRLTYSTTLMAKFLKNVEGKRVLDIGTGCGVLAILAAKRGAREVVAIDIQDEAVANCRQNIRKHHVEKKVHAETGDLFYLNGLFPKNRRFDVVISNLPIATRSPVWSHVSQGIDECLSKWVSDLPSYLQPEGVAYLSWASFGDPDVVQTSLRGSSLRHREFNEQTFGVDWQLFELRQGRDRNRGVSVPRTHVRSGAASPPLVQMSALFEGVKR